ncbi:MAG: hypothetical protein IPH03_08450 [Tetrasphaera sp.]|nr:hypothetical protein [Tetrasphaera sp.]
MRGEPALGADEVVDGGDLGDVDGRNPQRAVQAPAGDVLRERVEDDERILDVPPGATARHRDQVGRIDGHAVDHRQIGLQRGIDDQVTDKVDVEVAPGDVHRPDPATAQKNRRVCGAGVVLPPPGTAEREIAARQPALPVQLEFLGAQQRGVGKARACEAGSRKSCVSRVSPPASRRASPPGWAFVRSMDTPSADQRRASGCRSP